MELHVLICGLEQLKIPNWSRIPRAAISAKDAGDTKIQLRVPHVNADALSRSSGKGAKVAGKLWILQPALGDKFERLREYVRVEMDQRAGHAYGRLREYQFPSRSDVDKLLTLIGILHCVFPSS